MKNIFSALATATVLFGATGATIAEAHGSSGTGLHAWKFTYTHDITNSSDHGPGTLFDRNVDHVENSHNGTVLNTVWEACRQTSTTQSAWYYTCWMWWSNQIC